MSVTCAFKNCFNKTKSGIELTFFNIPKDDSEQRRLWVENSGNPEIAAAKSGRFVCEEHFEENDIRRQFNRAILRKNAVPRHWTETSKGLPNYISKEVIVIGPKRQKVSEKKVKAISYVVETIVEQPDTRSTAESEKVEVEENLEQKHQVIEVTEAPPYFWETGTQTESIKSADQHSQTESVVEPVQPKQKLDEDEFFAVNVIASLMKKFSISQKSKAKVQILDLLYKIEQEEVQE